MTEEEKEDALLPFADQGFEDLAALVGLLGAEWHEAARAVMRRFHWDWEEVRLTRDIKEKHGD